MSLKKNTIWSLVGAVLPMLLGLVTIPYLIEKVKIEAFGILTLVWSLIGYFSIFDFGIGRALTQQISSSLSKNVEYKFPGIVKTGLLFMLVTGLLGGILLALFSHQLSTKWMNVSKDLMQDTGRCLLLASIGIPLTTFTSGLKGVLEGFEDFKTVSILRIILGLFNFGLPALTVMFINNSLEYMVMSLVLARLFVLIAHLIFVNMKLSVYSILIAQFAKREEILQLLSFGAWMTLSNIISPLMVTADRFLISYVLGASIVAFYTVPFDFIVRLLIIPAALTGVLFPRFSYMFKNDSASIGPLYKKSFMVILIVMGVISFSLCVGSYFGLSIWVGNNFAEQSWMIASILSIGLLFNSLAQVPHAALQAAGNVKVTSKIHFFEFLFYIPLLYYALSIYGLKGAALIWVIRVLVDLISLSVFARKRIVSLTI